MKNLKNSIFAGIFIVPFIPVIVNAPTYYSLVSGKNFLFRIIVEILAILSILLIYTNKKYCPRFSWVFISILTFISVMTIADIFGENPFNSFWGDAERMEGLITLIHLFVYFIVITTVLNTEKLWKYFFNTIIAAGTITCVMGLLQIIGIAKVVKDIGRIDGSFGNSSWFAAYVLMLIFITLFMAIRHYGKIGRWVYGSLIIFQTIILYYTGTRGAILGLIGGVFTIALCIIVFEKAGYITRKYALLSIFTVLFIVGGFPFVQDQSFVKNNHILARFDEMISRGITEQSRYYFWLISIDAFKEKPILGWGQDNFDLAYYKHYYPELHHSTANASRSNRAHNVFFEWLVAGGITGVLTYISIYVAVFYYIWVHRESEWSIYDKSILTGLLIAYIINNFFLFDNIATYILFFTILGYVHFRSIPESKKNKVQRGQLKIVTSNLMFIPTVILIFLLVYMMNGKALLASYETHKGKELFETDSSMSFAYFQKALSRESFLNHDIQRELLILVNNAKIQNKQVALNNEFEQLAVREIEEQLQELPSYPRAYYLAGSFYYTIGDYHRAFELLYTASILSPKKQVILQKLRDVYVRKGDWQKAVEIEERIKQLN